MYPTFDSLLHSNSFHKNVMTRFKLISFVNPQKFLDFFFKCTLKSTLYVITFASNDKNTS